WEPFQSASICNSTVAIVKSGNLKRHYETTHKDFYTKFPPGSEVRKKKGPYMYIIFQKYYDYTYTVYERTREIN
ncbi:Hypothetical protein CINCED_3A019007, partial [Cinara cedri]